MSKAGNLQKMIFSFLALALLIPFTSTVVVRAQPAAPQANLPVPQQVRVVSGGGVRDVYQAMAQNIQYGKIVRPADCRPYAVIHTYGGTAFPQRNALQEQIGLFADAAAADLQSSGYHNVELTKVYAVFTDGAFSAWAISAAFQATDASGNVTYIPYAALGGQAATCMYGKGSDTLSALDNQYFTALTQPAIFDPFVNSGLSDQDRGIVSDLLYRNPAQYAVIDESAIFARYQDGMTREDFIYLLMKSLAGNFPDKFSLAAGAVLGQKAADVFQDTQMPYINMAYALGVAHGKGDNLFDPSGSISRQEAAVMIAGAIDKLTELGVYDPVEAPPLAFNDVAPDSWYAGSVALLSAVTDENGRRLLEPDDGGNFNPAAFCSKIAAIEMIGSLDSLLRPFAAASPDQTPANDLAGVKPADRSVIQGTLLPPAAFAAATVPEITARFDAPVDFSAPGVKNVSISLTDTRGAKKSIQARLTVYAGTAAITREASNDSRPLTIGDFLPRPQNLGQASLLTNSNYINQTKPGLYAVEIKLGGDIRCATVQVTDTTPPAALPQAVKIPAGQAVDPWDFVTDVQDFSAVSVSFAGGEPDTQTLGERSVAISLTDAFGNSSTVYAALTVLAPDSTPPVFAYIPNRYFEIGSPVDYLSQVAAEDDYDPAVTITYDASQVDVRNPGRYPVVYTATDASGNKAAVTAYIAMTGTPIDKTFSLADRVLASITDDGMTQTEVARAIYTWVTQNVYYVDTGDKIDPVSGAYNAFTKFRGDCYTYYAASEILLTRAGIMNREVQRLGGSSKHFWQFVNVGDGWYYFDSCPFAVKLDGFMFTDETARERTADGSRSYNFDRSLYTDIVIQ